MQGKWIEITLDNVEEFYEHINRLMIYHRGAYLATEWIPSYSTMAKEGGYYAYIVPEFMGEDNTNTKL